MKLIEGDLLNDDRALEPSRAPRHLDGLTSLRGIAALLVVLFHCQYIQVGFDLRPWTHLAANGFLAVDFFFVLSGFILGYAHAQEFDLGTGRYRAFLILRLGRIYPIHLLTLLVIAAIVIVLDIRPKIFSFTFETFVTNLLLMQSWGLHNKNSWNVPAWSVSAEWFVYLWFPVLLAISRRLAPTIMSGAIAALAMLGIWGCLTAELAFPGVTVLGKVFLSQAPSTRPFDLTYDYGLFRATCEFLAGLLLYRVFCLLKPFACRWSGALSLTAGGIVLLSLHFEASFDLAVLQSTVTVMAMCGLILCLALYEQTAASFLSWPLLRFLGEISYSFYLIHFSVLFVVTTIDQRVIAPPSHSLAYGFLASATIIGLSIALATVLNRTVEKPARGWVRKKLGGQEGWCRLQGSNP